MTTFGVKSMHTTFTTDELYIAIHSVNNGVILVDADGRITLFNPAAEAISGLSAEEVLGKKVDDIIPGTGMLRVLQTGLPEHNQRHQIGSSVTLTNRTPLFNEGKIIGAIAVFQDITALTSALAELEEVKRLKTTLETVVESLDECIVLVDKHGIITHMNKTYGEFLHINHLTAIGRHVSDVIPNTRMHLVAQDGKAEVTEIWKVLENTCIVTRRPIVKDGEIIGAVGSVVFKDVRDIKTLAAKVSRLESELAFYKEELNKIYGGKYTFENIIGSSKQMEDLKRVAIKAGKCTTTVLILGESGTGKELFAHAIHNASSRRQGPFIRVNCGALPENLLESELFGYDEGAFTGAKKGGKPGKFELANGGTIFLDEVGELTMAMQVKLLRVLQERELERVGGTKTTKLDIRVIAATNRDLDQMMDQGHFRQDLYYRLNVFTLHIPPLRERLDDLPLLCRMLLIKLHKQMETTPLEISPAALAVLSEYDWPGNVRELENILERTVHLMDEGNTILPEHLPTSLQKRVHQTPLSASPLTEIVDLAEVKDIAEKSAILQALERAGGNRSKAARILGINRSGFYKKLQKYGIFPSE